ncbi:hypothetical protein [Pyxidicoccus caerfyrddinensis]|uniref:hypothetical protein n=1 Tax=Pyxidicoccus caerfyrddinensis TaxID=2709663 RepID=UPI0013DAE8AE|nr:hypothetical protein [Pyxidicoccus caerfyrddinensis]
MRLAPALLLSTLIPWIALGEGVESKRPKADTADRVYAVTTMMNAPDGALITVGFNALRRMAPGAKKFEALHAIKGDRLYRIAMNDRGELLATWEKDPSIHYFTRDRQHVRIPKPTSPRENIYNLHVEELHFLPNGRDALVHLQGRETNLTIDYDVTFRVALDGRTPPMPVAQMIGARQIDMTVDRAIYVLPKKPGQMCEHLTCKPVEAVVADFFDADGNAQRKTLLDGKAMEIGNANVVWGQKGPSILLRVDLPKNQDVFARFRPGAEKPDLWPLKGFSSYDDRLLYALATGEVLQVKTDEKGLTLTRHLLDGSQQVSTVPALIEREDWDREVHGFGVRRDGRLWVHWGRHLLLFGKEPAEAPRSHDLEPLLARFTAWADVDIYVPGQDALWVGLDRTRSRDYARVNLADIEKRARPWAPRTVAASAQ